MRLPNIVALILGGAALTVHGQEAPGPKVATVDMKRIFDEYEKVKVADVRIDEAQAASEREQQQRKDLYTRLANEVAQLTSDVSTAGLPPGAVAEKLRQRDEKLNKLRAVDAEAQEFELTHTRQMDESMRRIREGVLADVGRAIRERVKTDGFDLVLDSAGKTINDQPLLTYRNPAFDITDSVIAILNRPKEAPAPPAPAPAK